MAGGYLPLALVHEENRRPKKADQRDTPNVLIKVRAPGENRHKNQATSSPPGTFPKQPKDGGFCQRQVNVTGRYSSLPLAGVDAPTRVHLFLSLQGFALQNTSRKMPFVSSRCFPTLMGARCNPTRSQMSTRFWSQVFIILHPRGN